MPTVAAIATIAGTVLTGVTTMQQMQYQGRIAEVNAQQMDLNAAAANQQGQIGAQDIGEQARGELGELRGSQGASGLAIGSPGFARGEAGFLGRAYRAAIRVQEGANQQSAAFQTQAGIYRADAQANRSAAPIALVSSVLAGIGGANWSGTSFVGGAQPTTAGAPTLAMSPVPRPRPRLNL